MHYDLINKIMRFFDLDRWNEIWQTISRNKKRSIMTAFGVFWGVFMLVVLLGFGMGLGNTFKNALGGLTVNSAFIFPNRTSIPYKGMPSGRWWKASMKDLENISEIKGVLHHTPIFWGRGVTAIYGNMTGEFSLSGFHPNLQKINPLSLDSGRFLNKLDEAGIRKVCMIGKTVENGLFKDEDPIGKTILANNTYFTVIGVVKALNDIELGSPVEEMIYIPSQLYQQLFNMGDKIDAIAFCAEENQNLAIIESQARKIVAAGNLISPEDTKAINGINVAEEFKKIQGLFFGVIFLTWVVGIGTLFAGIIGISNIMLVTVKERTQEIGIRRALGANPKVIIEQILSECFVLTFIAGIFGLAAAVALLGILDPILSQSMHTGSGMVVDTSFQIDFWTGILCAGILILGSIIAGIIPAGRALHIKAVDAIREE